MSEPTETTTIISRADAKAQGKKFFFTGLPCVHGHIAPRYLSGPCSVCQRLNIAARNKAKKEADPEAFRESVRQSVRRHYAVNKDSILEKKAKYYVDNAERIKAKVKARRDAKKAAANNEASN